MKLRWPVDGVGLIPGIMVVQTYYADPIATQDTQMGNILIRAGQRIYGALGMKSHGGIDISAPLDTPIRACADGFIVEQTAKTSGFGLRVSQVVDLGDSFLLLVYGHFHRFANNDDLPYDFWNRSKPVKEGDVIGFVDSTGFSSGNHVHLSVYQYDKQGNKLNANNGNFGQVDPMPYMKVRDMIVGYRKHPEKDLLIRISSMDELNTIQAKFAEILPDHQLETREFTLPLDIPPFP